jgi:hypothetical protein
MAIGIKNLSIKQKYKNINPVQLKRLNFLDKNKILCEDLRNLICNFKFCIDRADISKLKDKINIFLYDVNKVIKIINEFIKNHIKKKFLIINFDLYYNYNFIEVRNNCITLYNQDFTKMEYSESEIESESDEEELVEDYSNVKYEFCESESDDDDNLDLT